MSCINHVSFLFALFLVPLISRACEPDADQMEAYFARVWAQEKTYVDRLAIESDEIFIGKVAQIESVSAGPYAQRAVINVERLLKGSRGLVKRALMYKRVESSQQSDLATLKSIPGCDDLPSPVDPNPYVILKTRALFYVKSGALVRVHPYSSPPMSLAEETQRVQNQVQRSPQR